MSPVRASKKSVGGCVCRCGCLGALGNRACFDGFGLRLDVLSVRFRFRNSLDSLLSFRLSLSFLASSSAFLDCCFHLVISSFPDVPDRCLKYSVISFVIFSKVSCSTSCWLVPFCT